MTNDKNNDISTALDGIDIALDTIRGAMRDIDSFKAEIYDIMSKTTGDELFALDRDADAKEISELPRIVAGVDFGESLDALDKMVDLEIKGIREED